MGRNRTVSVQRIDLEPSLHDDMELGILSSAIAANVPHISHTKAYGVQGYYVAQKYSSTIWTSVDSRDSIQRQLGPTSILTLRLGHDRGG